MKADISNLSVTTATEIRLPIDHVSLIPEAIGWPPRFRPRANLICLELGAVRGELSPAKTS